MTCRVSDIFDVRYGHSLELNRLVQTTSQNGIPFVSRKRGDNGVSAYVDLLDGIEPAPAGDISCALSGNVLTTNLQNRAFYTGYHVAVLRPKIELTTSEILYYCFCIKSNSYRYNYGRQANKTLSELLVPSVNCIPNWVNTSDVEQFKGADNSFSKSPSSSLEYGNWKNFRYDEIFEIKKGKRLTQAYMAEGGVPFVGSIDHNNGVAHHVGQSAIFKGNTITVNYNGSVAEAFYQSEPYWASDDANVLYPKFRMTPYTGLFLCTLIKQEKFRFNYGRKWHKERMEKSTIRLPVNSIGKPNWQFMEDYIKSLPYSSNLE